MPFVSSTRGSFGPQSKSKYDRGIQASGGAETTSGIYKIHTFTTNGNFIVQTAPAEATIDLLMVGGGGGGGATGGGNCGHGGGGAGGLIYRTSESITAGTYPIVIGQGGLGCLGDGAGVKPNAANGTDTTFKGLTALGGGGANCGNSDQRPANNGGSGGGGQHASNTANLLGGNALQPSSASGGFGNKGGDGPISGNSSPCWTGGGGGGAGAVGTNGSAQAVAPGGIGRQYDISGTPTYYAGGGGAGMCNGSQCQNSSGGLGGGGTGTGGDGAAATSTNRDATPNTGGGGGGLVYNTTGSFRAGQGATGIVIIRYTQ